MSQSDPIRWRSPAARFYRAFSSVFAFAAPRVLRYRAARGKEDPARLGERLGRPSSPRSKTPPVWIHAVSVGEMLAVLPLVEHFAARFPVLLTGVTTSAARLIAPRLPAGAVHQFAPLDCPSFVASFLQYWRPALAVFAESEWWPTMLQSVSEQQIPAVLANARLSPHSFRRWRLAPVLARDMLGSFRLILPQDSQTRTRLLKLGGENLAARMECGGNLKYDSPPLPVEDKELAAWRPALAGRPCWLAASTHPGEEHQLLAAHKILAARYAGLLTIIAPRHPARGKDLARWLKAQGVAVQRRAESRTPPSRQCALYLADSLGELGLFIRLAAIVFMGGSLIRHGGQNPLEAARLARPVLFGRHMFNFAEPAAALVAEGAARTAASPSAIAAAVSEIFADPALAAQKGRAAQQHAQRFSGALARHIAAINKLIS